MCVIRVQSQQSWARAVCSNRRHSMSHENGQRCSNRWEGESEELEKRAQPLKPWLNTFILGLHWAVSVKTTRKGKKKVAQKQDRGLFLPDTLMSKELVHGHYNTPHGQGPKLCLVSQLCVIHDLRWFQVVLRRKKCSRRAHFFFPEVSRKLLNDNFIYILLTRTWSHNYT